MFRPQIKVLDCTVRDGGLINNWQFSDDFVRKVFLALSHAGCRLYGDRIQVFREIFFPE